MAQEKVTQQPAGVKSSVCAGCRFLHQGLSLAFGSTPLLFQNKMLKRPQRLSTYSLCLTNIFGLLADKSAEFILLSDGIPWGSRIWGVHICSVTLIKKRGFKKSTSI